jgi:3-oxoacyl-[acyl-carrier-protein] synthase II
MSGQVWITGIGAVTGAGPGCAALRALLGDARSAVRPDEMLGGRPVARCAPPARDRASRRLDRGAALFRAACIEAWEDAGLDGRPSPARAGLIEGSSLGPMCGVLEDHARLLDDPRHRARPSDLTRFMTGAGGALFAQEAGIRGPVFHLSAGSVSSACAIGDAFERVASGRLDVVVAGGAESPLHAGILATFEAAGVLSRADAAGEPCRPFDAARAGTVLGEGAAALVIESEAHARARGAAALACITGYGFCAEAYDLTAPDPEGTGVREAIGAALRSRPPSSIGWVKAHGTGTVLNDAAELRALSLLLGPALASLPVTSLKPSLGHCLGASGAVEAVAAVLALRESFVPATLGYHERDEALPACLVPRAALRRGGPALLLSESFGGRCAALVLAAA